MSRPRKAEDPVRWPVPCSRCAQHHQVVANWPDGGICGYCYQQAKRIRGTCRCGHEGVLPGLVDSQPACRRCSGVKLNLDCRGCGTEDELYAGARCWACTLASTVDRLLTNPSTGSIAPELVPLAEALKSMKRANSGLTWIRQQHVIEFLETLAVTPTVTHEAVDSLPSSRTREYVRGLLVEHGVLPQQDLYRARYDEWARTVSERLIDPVNREVIRRFLRWQHQRRMNQMDLVPQGTFLRSKQTVTVAIDFLNWLTDHGIELAELEQEHLDAWQATGPSTRLVSDRFLRWAIKTRLVHSDLSMQRHRRGTSPRMNAADQELVVQRVVHTDELTPRDRAAAILVLVFGQEMEDVVALTWDDVKVTDDLITVQIGTIEIALPSPLDEPWRQLAESPGHDLTASHPASNWVFRGHSPGRHISSGHLRTRLRDVFSTRAARLGTLHELTKLAPVAILAEALGYSPATIERHAVDSATAYARYVAAAHENRRSSRPS
jgi:hypothetical protein